MVSNIKYFEYIVTDSEIEALVLECNLIKKHSLPFRKAVLFFVVLKRKEGKAMKKFFDFFVAVPILYR